MMPLSCAVVEDVQASTKKGTRWNRAFSQVQVGKLHLYRLLTYLKLEVQTREGWQTNALRDKYRLIKTKQKARQVFESHAVDAWVLAASVTGATKPTCTRLWYVVPIHLHRRQLHAFQPATGGIRRSYGGTRSWGFKRGTLVKHPKYGLCTIGGYNLKRNSLSLHEYRTNKRLTQGAKVEACYVLTWVAFRSWLVA